MGLLGELTHGGRGLKLALPGRFELQSDEQNSASLVEVDHQAVFFLFHFPLQLDLRSEHEGLLSRDIERHARELFETHFSHQQSQQPAGAAAARPRPRTADPAWSPVVSIERVWLGNCEALSVVHRMAYQPGLEIVMGHLLVPLRSGLFELRLLAGNRGPTGVRESAILQRAMQEANVQTRAEAEALMKRQTPDDPRYDAAFPDHPLTVVRGLLRRVAMPGVIEVTDPTPLPPAGEVVLPEIGCAVMLPPRYVQAANRGGTFVQFSRVAFAGGEAGSDGVQVLTLMSLAGEVIPDGPERQKTLTAHARSLAESLTRGASGVRIETWMSSGGVGGVQALAHAEFQPGAQGGPKQRAIFCLFTGTGGVEKTVMLVASACIPKEEMLADIEVVTRSWRLLGGTDAPPPVSAPPVGKKKKWWPF
jgi:hypothetical protein